MNSMPSAVDFSSSPGGLFRIEDVMRCIDETQKKLFVAVKKCVVAISREDGTFIGTGFIFSPKPLIFTSAHVVEGLQWCVITRIDGEVEVKETVQVVYRAFSMDVADLKAKESFSNFLLYSPCYQSGETGYVFGYDEDTILKMSSGIMSEGIEAQSFGKEQESFIACHADHGYSGGPVTNYFGHVKGMVVGSKGISLRTTRYLPTSSLNRVLQEFKLVDSFTLVPGGA